MIGVLVIPVLVAVALAAGPMRDRPDGPRRPTARRRADRRRGAGADRAAVHRCCPAPPARPPPQPPVPVFRLTQDQAGPAVGYVTAANTHDARPGGDKSFTDAYARTRPYVTDALYQQVSGGEPRRGDYEWAAVAGRQGDRRGAGAGPACPTGRRHRPRPPRTSGWSSARPSGRRPAPRRPTPTVDALNMLVTRGSDGRWLVSRLLADV